MHLSSLAGPQVALISRGILCRLLGPTVVELLRYWFSPSGGTPPREYHQIYSRGPSEGLWRSNDSDTAGIDNAWDLLLLLLMACPTLSLSRSLGNLSIWFYNCVCSRMEKHLVRRCSGWKATVPTDSRASQEWRSTGTVHVLHCTVHTVCTWRTSWLISCRQTLQQVSFAHQPLSADVHRESFQLVSTIETNETETWNMHCQIPDMTTTKLGLSLTRCGLLRTTRRHLPFITGYGTQTDLSKEVDTCKRIRY